MHEVIERARRRQHQDPGLGSLVAHGAADLVAVNPREVAVEHEHVVADDPRLDECLLAVGREIDGGTLNIKVTLPAVVTVDLRIVAPTSVSSMHSPAHKYADGVRFAALMAIMGAKKKPLAEVKLADLAADGALKI